MRFPEVKDLCLTFSASQMKELELKGATYSIRLLKKSAQPQQQLPAKAIALASVQMSVVEPVPDLVISSPGVGSFLPFHPAKCDDVYGPGRTVSIGEKVGFLQVGFLLFPVHSRFDGVILETLVEKGAIVDYDTALFKIRSQGAN